MSLKKKNKDCVPFIKAKTKERKKAFSCESAADPTSSNGKGSFYNQNEKLREIEEHEHKSVMSEKQSVEMSSLKPFQNSVARSRRSMFATSPVSTGAEMLAAILDRFLVWGIFTNLATIEDKVIKMFSLLCVKYLRSQSNDSVFTNLKE